MPPGYHAINWDTVALDYITGDQSLSELARAHGVSYSRVMTHRRAEDWEAQRIKHRTTRKTIVKKVRTEEIEKEAARTFRTSEEIRHRIHDLSGHLTQRIQDLFINPRTGKPRAERPTPRALKDLVETLERTYKLEMNSGGHVTEADRINLDARVLVAGVTAEQLTELGDDALDQVLATAAQAAKKGLK